MAAEMNDRPEKTPLDRRVSRRRLLKVAGASAGLFVTWSSGAFAAGATPGASPVASPGASPVASPAATPTAAAVVPRQPPTNVDAYLQVNEDGTVTLLTGKVEYGQGIQTGFMQLVAEELDVAFDNVNIIMGETDKAPYDLGTFGSLSTRVTGPRIRQAAATMRQWLLELAADQLQAPATQLQITDGTISLTSDASKSVTFAALAAGKHSERELDEKAPLKDPSAYKVVGQSLPRVDVPHKVDGSMKYGYDWIVDGMGHGRLVRAPALGAKLQSLDMSEAAKMPGVVGVFQDGDFAGVSAERIDQADAALAAVKATWSTVKTGHTSENIHDLIKSTARSPQVLTEKPGDPDKALTGAAKKVSATFRVPYVNHCPIEPRSATARPGGDSMQVWSSTQDPFSAQSAVAQATGLALDNVVVTPLMSGGAFGSKIQPTAAVEAARLAKGLNKPVRINWTREEEFQWGLFRPAAQIEISAGLDADGNVAGWKYDLYSAGFFPEGAEKPSPAASDWSADANEIYDLPQAKTTFYQGDSPLPVYFWRVNGASANTFAREVVIDELAEQAGIDPVSFRMKLLANNPRMQGVLKAVVEKAGWKPGVGKTGQGIGVALVFEADSYVAEVAHVSVDTASGKIQVKHVNAALDVGLIVNPEAVTHQVEGGITLSLGPTLTEEIKFADGKILNATLEQYKPMSMENAPTIDVSFVENKHDKMAGVGEPSVSPVPAAVANAVYDLTGVRLRQLPFTPDRVLAALNGKAD